MIRDKSEAVSVFECVDGINCTLKICKEEEEENEVEEEEERR